ncbi:MAG: DUF427 domain-containing protein [Betaproteobacteria bacterium]|nr:DUF427 domain-containing protein [Betaproteobacteria bacterium]
MSANSGPGFTQYPNHRLVAKPADSRVRVTYRGVIIADTREAVQLEETMEGSTVAPIVYYLPRKDVKMERLVRTEHETYCPFKGRASYYSIVGGPENAAWTYERPYDEMVALKGRLAFYPDKVDSIAASRD